MLTQPFTQMIEAYTGLQMRSQHTIALWQKIQSRMKALKFTTPEQYYQYLINCFDSGSAIQINPEWQSLIQLLMTGESYFLRDQGQFRLLQQQILPELIHERRQQAASHQAKPALRIWSAGCSTGEEAYSLAMLVQQLIPDWRNWDLLILGTDINAEAIAHARRGIYHSWSFRMMSADERSKYFRADQGAWKLDERIRSVVTFRLGNLVQDRFPDIQSDLCDMDLIVCRNVFIYFALESIAAIVEKFSKTLHPCGYLMTGHTELHGQNLAELSAQVFPESVVYRRSPTSPTSRGSEQHNSVDHQSYLSPVLSIDQGCYRPTEDNAAKHLSQDPFDLDQQALGKAEQCFQQGDYAGTIAIAESAIAQAPQSFELYYLMAQSYIRLGAYEQAKWHAQTAAEIDALSTASYYLLAYIAREQEQWEEAKALLKRIIYLDPVAITAYLELSSLYTQEGNVTRAKKMQTTALELIQQSTVSSELIPTRLFEV